VSQTVNDEALLPIMRFSVIIPLESHRGLALRCVRAWTQEQVFPREQFEIVIASPPGHPPAQLDEIRSLLGLHDQLVQFDRHHDMDLCAEAAKHTRGEFLLFTESHCLPEPDTLTQADLAAQQRPELAGFSCQSIPITGNLLSQVEAMSYGRDIAFGLIEHPWRKVLDQCFVIRREAYFQAGGFEPEFGHFAEWLIAARFHTLGLPIGYVPAVRIHHLYSGRFGEWQRFTADFIEGQMRFLGLEPSDPLRTMFDEVPEWSGRHSLQRDASRRICRLLTLDLRAAGASSGRVSRLREWHWGLLAVWLWRSVAGDSAVLVRAHVQRMSARLLLQADLLLRNRPRAERRLARCSEAIAKLERTRFLRKWRHDSQRNPTGLLPLGGHEGSWEPGVLAEEHGVGFHLASGTGLEAIRWSEPAAYVEIPLAPGRYEIKLNWLFRPPTRGRTSLRFFLDEHEISDGSISIHQDHVELHLEIADSSSPTRLGWVCSAHHAQRDERALGLPVTSITWTRDESHLAGAPVSSSRQSSAAELGTRV
jgi:hypothetical protein